MPIKRPPPGISANPAGRPKGSRNKLSAAVLDDLIQAWSEQATGVVPHDGPVSSGLAALRISFKEKPTETVKMYANLLPKEVDMEISRLAGLSDDELADRQQRMDRLFDMLTSQPSAGEAVN